jgi:nicotinic acid phosphoribosyltransferase
MDFNGSNHYPEGVISFLDTDLYKLTMQCAVLKYFPDVQVTYAFKNRTPEKKLSRAAFKWLEIQISSEYHKHLFSCDEVYSAIHHHLLLVMSHLPMAEKPPLNWQAGQGLILL